MLRSLLATGLELLLVAVLAVVGVQLAGRRCLRAGPFVKFNLSVASAVSVRQTRRHRTISLPPIPSRVSSGVFPQHWQRIAKWFAR